MSKIKVAQIGCGGRNGAHFQKLSSFEDVDIVGFCDVLIERAEARANTYGSGKCYTDYVKMLDETQPEVVFIAVPPHVHGEIEPELIKRKIHFLVEKPMALDYAVAEKICDDAEAAGILTAVGFQDRYQSITQIMKDYITGKDVGLVTGSWIGGIPGVPWWRTFETSGGQIVEQNIHLFDQLRFIFGEPDSVYCAAGKGIVDPEAYGVPGYNVDDFSSAVMKFKCGMVANLFTACYIRPGSKVTNGITVYGKDFTVEYNLRHSLTITDTNGTRSYVRKDDQLITTAADGTVTTQPDTEQTGLQDRAFLDAIKTGDTSKILATYRDALKSLKLTMACNESAVSGNAVKL
ncbi:MAG: Gfo/Idh/MocA family oxidoreductase [Clostridiales bacterium]|nr:Gfo/Idh/MocA family oxidoreductase [Clostridiales bacterium]